MGLFRQFSSETTFLKSTTLNISKILETLRLTKMMIKDKIQTKDYDIIRLPQSNSVQVK